MKAHIILTLTMHIHIIIISMHCKPDKLAATKHHDHHWAEFHLTCFYILLIEYKNKLSHELIPSENLAFF